MNSKQFGILSNELREVAAHIPLNWGRVQNDLFDGELKARCNIFDIASLAELEANISDFDDEHKTYYKRRWYVLQCANCDEYLFYCNEDVGKNPDKFDKSWDIKINDSFYFDVKGTVVPKQFRDRCDDVISNPEQIIQFYYDKQSTGVRNDIQNRLFVVHHSFVDASREFYLRCAWETKALAYRRFIENIDNVQLFEYKGCSVAVIFIIERVKGKAEVIIPGLDG